MTSERVNALGMPAEVFYRRLMSVVDDFGRYYAKPELLLAALYPLRIEKVRKADVATWIGETCEAGLARKYTVDGKDYLELADFRQQVRAAKSKYPQPPADAQRMRSKCVADAQQPPASAHLDGVVVGDVSEDVKPLAPSVPPDATASPANGKGVAYIPVVDGSEFPITEPMVKEFESLYPAVDVLQTLREIRGWNLANPTKRKTKTGVLRHVNSWLAKEQNKGA